MASHWFQKEEKKQRNFLINLINMIVIGPWNFLYVIISSCSDIPPPALSCNRNIHTDSPLLLPPPPPLPKGEKGGRREGDISFSIMPWSIQKHALTSDLGEPCITGGGLCHQRYNLTRFTALII
jgi:hypothetical protein